MKTKWRRRTDLRSVVVFKKLLLSVACLSKRFIGDGHNFFLGENETGDARRAVDHKLIHVSCLSPRVATAPNAHNMEKEKTLSV